MQVLRAVAFLAAVILSLATFAAEQDDAAKAELAKWQGTWRVVSMEHDGELTPPEKLKAIKLTVQDDAYHFENGDFSERGTYRFDPSKDPKALDIVVGEGNDRGKTYLVIYKVEGEDLTICLQSDNKARPLEFTGKAGSGCVLEVWKREK